MYSSIRTGLPSPQDELWLRELEVWLVNGEGGRRMSANGAARIDAKRLHAPARGERALHGPRITSAASIGNQWGSLLRLQPACDGSPHLRGLRVSTSPNGGRSEIVVTSCRECRATAEALPLLCATSTGMLQRRGGGSISSRTGSSPHCSGWADEPGVSLEPTCDYLNIHCRSALVSMSFSTRIPHGRGER
jgi:hypothetical protein